MSDYKLHFANASVAAGMVTLTSANLQTIALMLGYVASIVTALVGLAKYREEKRRRRASRPPSRRGFVPPIREAKGGDK